ncbi:hypothetical protein FIBSPDRAFT_901989 [Athelia psychrophila]|uniref:Uncharacterized protein n=1 Tax=Athelia psychrophila TaxID=1759441 RepID=A0A167XS63_9AGAM|nr:hypothetical protein FIBSPDRAFT_901989 [Fibularhizoctonia sp. CBS 109695]
MQKSDISTAPTKPASHEGAPFSLPAARAALISRGPDIDVDKRKSDFDRHHILSNMLQYGDPVHSLPIKPDFRPVDLRQNKQDPKQNPRTSLSSGRHLGDLVRDRCDTCREDQVPEIAATE